MNGASNGRAALFNNANLTDAQMLAAIEWALDDLSGMKRAIERTNPNSYGCRGKDVIASRRTNRLLISVIRTLDERRGNAKREYENSPEFLLLEIFGKKEESKP